MAKNKDAKDLALLGLEDAPALTGETPTYGAMNDLARDALITVSTGGGGGGGGAVNSVNGHTGTVHLTATDVQAVPLARTVNGHGLVRDVTLTAADVKARPDTYVPTAAEVKAVPVTRTVNNKALGSNIALNASDVGAADEATTVNGHPLTANVTLDAADVGARADNWLPTPAEIKAVPETRTINKKPLSADVALDITDVGGLDEAGIKDLITHDEDFVGARFVLDSPTRETTFTLPAYANLKATQAAGYPNSPEITVLPREGGTKNNVIKVQNNSRITKVYRIYRSIHAKLTPGVPTDDGCSILKMHMDIYDRAKGTYRTVEYSGNQSVVQSTVHPSNVTGVSMLTVAPNSFVEFSLACGPDYYNPPRPLIFTDIEESQSKTITMPAVEILITELGGY